MVARRGKAMVGVMAAWDQAAYKQDIVEATGRRCAACVPSTTSSAGFLRARPLTPPGQAIPLAFAACVCIADDDPAVMRALLSACAERATSRDKRF